MTKKLTGGCLCGALRYECDGEPKEVTYCHCTDCQKTTGSAFCVGVAVDTDALRILSGSVKEYTKTADSGNPITRQFCPECGSPLFTRSAVLPHLVWVKAGSLDEPELVKPTHQTWTDYAVPWAYIDANLPGFAKGGPSPTEEEH